MLPQDVRNDLDEKYAGILMKFVSDIKNGKLKGANNIAISTISLIEQIINESQNTSAFELCEVVREVGKLIYRALPLELVAVNMVRRVLKAIRDEIRTDANQSREVDESLKRLVLARSHTIALNPTEPDLKESLRDHIAELKAELESSTMSICSTAQEHVHPDELILTYGASNLAERFFRSVARRYRLILVEGPAPKQSHAMAGRLSAAGVTVTVISNSCVYLVMSRVNKVVVGVQSALGGGAVLACAGIHTVTIVAKHFSVPVIALAPLYKLSPLYIQHQFNSLAAPHQALPYENFGGVARVYATMYDFVPPDHVTLFITNLGGSSPSYIYRLLSELYDPKDFQI